MYSKEIRYNTDSDEPSANSISNNYKMLAAANNNTAATPKRRGSSSGSSLRDVGLRSEHSSSINLSDTSERSALVDGNDVLLKDTSERSYHQQSEELVHNTSDSSFIKVALLKQKQKIWSEQHEMDNKQGDSMSDDVSIYSWDRKLSILKQKQRNKEDMNEQRKQQQKQQKRLSTASSSAAETSQTTSDISTSNKEQQIDILTEGQHYLSISMLVYMYSHLRETCRMGHTRINFEDIDVNSFQCLYGRLSILGQQGRGRSSGSSGASGEVSSERIRYLDKTKSSGSIIRVVIDELGGLGSSGMNCGEDKRDYDLIGVNASREYEQSMMREFYGWIEDSKVSQLDASTEEVINNLKRQAARRRWKRAKSIISIGRMLNRRLSDEKLRRSSTTSDEGTESLPDMDTLDPNKYQMVHHLRRQVARYRWRRAITRIIIQVKLGKSFRQTRGLRTSQIIIPKWSSDSSLDKRAKDKQGENVFVDMKRLVDTALTEQPKFFKDGSVMNNLIESGIEVVWFSDVTQSDVVYGICVQREEKRITVIFRGTVNSHNWLINMKYGTSRVSNPVTDEYPGRKESLDIHTGFSLYMLRRRKDTQMNKIEEIMEKIDTIGREMAPDGSYKISITGHSMGAALATLLGFYVAASDKFVNVDQVRVMTFASPRVGASSFLHAYQHLERIGRIRHARFSNNRDLVPLVQFTNFQGINPFRWQFYKHVGMRIQLHGTGRLAKWHLRNALDVTYPLHHDWLSELRRMVVTNNVIPNLTTPAGYRKNHTLTEYQRRIHFTSQYRMALAKSIYYHDQRRNRIKSLDEYYCIRANASSDGVSDSLNSLSYNRGRKNLFVLIIVAALVMFWSALVAAILESLSTKSSQGMVRPRSTPPPMYDTSSVKNEVSVSGVGTDQDRPTRVSAGEEVVSSQLNIGSQLQAVEVQLNPITEYATGITFDPKLEDGLYLVGAGVRKKSIIKVYAVAMYSSPKVLVSASSSSLGSAARTFTPSSPMTTFILEMVYSVSAEKIASAIGESVRPRYSGSSSDIDKLESLIIEGVNKVGGQASKGTTFRFDCSSDGVSVSVNDSQQGTAVFDGLGGSFVDVFMDDNAVSPTLVDSCNNNWSNKKAIASSLMELSSMAVGLEDDTTNETSEQQTKEVDSMAERVTIEAKLRPIQEYATSVTFAPILDEGLYLVGAGVRKKSIIKVYAVAMYGSASLLNNISSSTLGKAARSFGSLSPVTSFVLEMVYSVSAEKIASAIGESVRPRYDGESSDIDKLESLIIEGVNKVGGHAVKGTTFRFDCTLEGVKVSVGGAHQGTASFNGLGSSLVDVFMDDNAVSPTLVDSCIDTWSSDDAKILAASLLDVSQVTDALDNEESDIEEQEPDKEAIRKRQEIESKLSPIQEYATSISFDPKLEDGLYLVGAGVRKKSIIKVYAVAMYSSPEVLVSASSSSLGSAARTFISSSPMTTFILEMVYSVSAEKIASAIGESVRPRYSGSPNDIDELESLINEGVNKVGGQASKGTTFRFDCSSDGVSVSVNESPQGTAAFDGLGSSFVDVFMDDNAVSPTLVDNCLDTWSSDEARSLAISLHALSEMNHVDKSEVTEPPIPNHQDEIQQPDLPESPTMDSPTALPTESTFNTCTGYLCEEPSGFPVGKVKIRSRYSYNKSQEPAALDTVESISMDDIRTMASDLAAQRLHVLASQIDDNDNAHKNSEHSHMKRVLKKLFPVF